MRSSYKTLVKYFAMTAVALCVATTSAGAQSCRPYDEQLRAVISHIERIAVATDPPLTVLRSRYNLPQWPVTVTVVMDEATCARAALEYARYLAKDSTISTTTRRVYVLFIDGGEVRTKTGRQTTWVDNWESNVTYTERRPQQCVRF